MNNLGKNIEYDIHQQKFFAIFLSICVHKIKDTGTAVNELFEEALHEN